MFYYLNSLPNIAPHTISLTYHSIYTLYLQSVTKNNNIWNIYMRKDIIKPYYTCFKLLFKRNISQYYQINNNRFCCYLNTKIV